MARLSATPSAPVCLLLSGIFSSSASASAACAAFVATPNTTRRALADKAARLDVKWVSLVIDYDPTEEINSVGLATADDEEGKNETVLFDKKVIDPLHVIVKELLTESDVPLLFDHNISLRRFHRGFEISVYDVRPYIEHQVFYFKV